MTVYVEANMSIDRLAQLKSLHLYGMATAWSELLAEKEHVGPCSRKPGWIA